MSMAFKSLSMRKNSSRTAAEAHVPMRYATACFILAHPKMPCLLFH